MKHNNKKSHLKSALCVIFLIFIGPFIFLYYISGLFSYGCGLSYEEPDIGVIEIYGGNTSATNWEWASNQTWCSGSGTEDDPYCINNTTFYGYERGSCLIIYNSKEQVIIKNCAFRDSLWEYERAGLKLFNCRNIKIIDCEFNDNEIGLFLYNCSDITIEKNSIEYSQDNAIFIEESAQISVIKNKIINNDDGVYILQSLLLNLTNNKIKDTHTGIGLTSSDYCLIENNRLEENYIGISLFNHADHNKIISNEILWNEDNGIYLHCSSRNIIKNNEIYENKIGIELQHLSEYNEIKCNQLYGNEYYLIEEESCSHNRIRDNDPNIIKESINTEPEITPVFILIPICIFITILFFICLICVIIHYENCIKRRNKAVIKEKVPINEIKLEDNCERCQKKLNHIITLCQIINRKNINTVPKYCKNCGNLFKEDANFCYYCGSPSNTINYQESSDL